MASATTISVLPSGDEAAARWRALWSSGTATVFQSPAFVETVLAQARKHGTDRQNMLFAFMSSDGQDFAGFHVLSTRENGLRVLRHPGIGECDYAGPLLRAPSDASRFVEHWPALRAALPRHDVLHMRQMPEKPVSPEELGGLQRAHTHAHPVRLTTADPIDLLPTSKLRSDLRRRRRKLEAQGDLAFFVATPPDVPALYQQLVDWRIARFTAMGKDDPLLQPAHRDLYLDLATRHPDTAVVSGLSLDGHPIALQFGLLDHDRYCQIVTAFEDGPHKVNAPARLLMLDMMRWTRDCGLPIYDFTVGDEPYKDSFGADRLPIHEIVLPRTMAGQVYTFYKRCEFAVEAYLERRQST